MRMTASAGDLTRVSPGTLLRFVLKDQVADQVQGRST